MQQQGLLFTETQRKIIRDSARVTSTVSFVSCALILFNAVYLAKSTTKAKAAQLIYFLALTDLGYTIACLCFDTDRLEIEFDSDSENDFGSRGGRRMIERQCKAQGFFVQLFSTQTAMWSFAMSHFTYSLVCEKRTIRDMKSTRFYCVLISVTSFAMAFVPLLNDSYGDARIGKCHIKNDGTEDAVIARFLVFYAPIWLIMIMNFYVWVKIFKTLKTLRKFLHNEQSNGANNNNTNNVIIIDDELEEDWAKVDILGNDEDENNNNNNDISTGAKNAVKKAETLCYALSAYPIIQIVTNVPGSLMRIENLFDYESPDVNVYLATTHVVLKNLQGFFHLVVFVFVHPNKTEVKETLSRSIDSIRRCFCIKSNRRRFGGGAVRLNDDDDQEISMVPFEIERS